ncbi:hypothetical protein RSAG8_09750, partial [Rhizoctonia solani AG-8 WAC10335]
MSAFKSLPKAPRRAPSPAAAAFHLITPGFASHIDPTVVDGASTAKSQDVNRIYLIQQLDTFNEICDILPHPYREMVKPGLGDLFKLSEKVQKAESAYEGLKTHEQKLTWPSQLMGINTPRFQNSAEYEATNEAATMRSWFEETTLEYKKQVLNKAIAMKEQEIILLRKRLHPEVWLSELAATCEKAFSAGPATVLIPVASKDRDGNPTIEYQMDPTAEVVYSQVKAELVYVGHAVIRVSNAKVMVSKDIKAKKQELKNKADVEMSDGSKPGPSGLTRKEVDDIVSKSVAKALKDNKANQGQKTSKKGPRKPPTNVGKGKAPEAKPSQATSSTANVEAGGGKKSKGAKRKVSKTAEKPKGKRTKTTCFLISIATDTDRAIALCRSGIHVGPGVPMFFDMHVPGFSSLYEALADVNFGAGLKYMFPRRISYDLPRVAYEQWCNTIRWKFHMRDKVNRDFEPELLLRSDSLAEAAPQFIENGLRIGREQLESQLLRIENEVVDIRLPFAVDKLKTCQLLEEHNLILVPSDKNLGCALITKDWFLEQAMAHLSNVNSYRKVTQNEAIEQINEQARACEALGFHPYVCVRENGKILRSQKSKWVTQYVEKLKKDATPVLLATPRFYVIPKIHKSPWKGRPIVPAHSAVHSPAAKLTSWKGRPILTSMMLKPLVKRQPYIIHGSKDFIQKVSQIRWYREEKSRIFIVGGDIEAYYPNVPKGKASQIVKEMMDSDPRQSEENFGSFFEECLDCADQTVVMRFQDDWYVQTDGLSMGVAHAPDMANLYGSFYENQIIPTLGEDILYYVHSPAAKLTSMMLKPLVKRQPYIIHGSKDFIQKRLLVKCQPYIIHGSKDFIQKVSQIRWYREEKSRIFIVGGDIEAYYPNVPKGKASQIVKEMMDSDPRQSEENFGSFFEECLDCADQTVVMRFQDDWYVQTDGLSMGVAHAPDMANLYGSFYENQIIPTLGKDILYYGRYIDDVFFVVRANNAEAAGNLCKNLVIGGVKIVWEPPKQYGVFLDDRFKERQPPKDVQVLRSTFNPIWEHVSISEIQNAVGKQWEKDAHWRALFGGGADLPPDMVKPLIVGRKKTKNLGDLVARMRKIVLNYNDVDEELGREVTDAWKS